MEFERSTVDASAQGNNGSPLTPGEDLDLISFLSPTHSKDALRAFIQHGRTNKEDAARLFKFCHSSEFSWFDDEDSGSSTNSSSGSSNNNNNMINKTDNQTGNTNNNDNNAAARPAEPSDSTDMSASSSSSSQNPPTQPQTPTFTHNSSIGQEYYLPEDHLPDHDNVGLETFLLSLLGAQPRPIPQEKVKKLYDMSRLPGHGTDEGFQALVSAANSAPNGSGLAAPVAVVPMMPGIKYPVADIPDAETDAAHLRGPLALSSEQDHLSHLDHYSHGNCFSQQVQVQIDHCGSFPPPSQSGAILPNSSMPITMQQGNVQQFVAPAALSLSAQRRNGTHNLMSPGAVSRPMTRGDSGHRDSATSPSGRASSLGSPHTMAPQSSPQQSNDPRLVAQASPEPSEAAASPSGDPGNKMKLTCPMSKECNKTVESDNETNAYKYLIEHIRRVHPDNHIPHLPSTKESVDKMINVEVAVCTLLVHGVPCDFRLAGQKGSRSPWRQALNHIRDSHPEKYEPGLAANKNSFTAMMKGGTVVRCPLPTKEDGSPCSKVCMGEKAYRSIIEHARRSHPDRYTKTPSSSKEGWLAILRHNGISASAMQRSVSDGSSSSGHSSTPPAVQRQSTPRQLPITPASLSVQMSTTASGNLQVPVSQSPSSALISAEQEQVALPGGPREFVDPYMLQHEVNAMALYQQQNGQVEPMSFDGQPVLVPVPFSAEHGSQNLAHDAHARQLSMDGALKPYFGNSFQASQLDPTLGRPLFASLNDNIAEPQTPFTNAKHLSEHNRYRQRPLSHVQAAQALTYSRDGADLSSRKRSRDDREDFDAGGQEPLSKKVSARPQTAALSSHTTNGLPRLGGIGGAIPPLTNEWFGLSLEKLAGDHFSILLGATITAMTMGLPESLGNKFYEELLRRWPSADELAGASTEGPEGIMAMMAPMNLGPVEAARLCDTLQRLAKDYVNLPPTKDRRFGCENYPAGAIHNVVGGEVFEAEEKGLVSESHALNTSWEISHITKRHFVIDAWRIFGRDVLLGRAQDWKGTGAAPGFEPEWKRVIPQDPPLRTFLGWLWMKEGVFWDPLTDVKQPLHELTRLAINQSRVHFHTSGQFYFRTSEDPDTFELIDASGASPSMARYMLNGASMGSVDSASRSVSGAANGFMNGPLPTFHGFAQNAALPNTATQHNAALTSTAPALGSTVHAGFTDGFSLPIDGPDSHAGLSAFDGSMFDGGDSILNGQWSQYFE